MMSLIRPKRKATINKSYNDTLEELQYDDSNLSSSTSVSSMSSGSVKRKLKKSITPIDPNVSPISNKAKPVIPYNWQPPPVASDFFSEKLDLTGSYIDLQTQTLTCPNHTNYKGKPNGKSSQSAFSILKGEYIYMVSEPPGEPYYIGRVMGFKPKKKLESSEDSGLNSNLVETKDYLFQIQWFYRPRDISKVTSDSRLLFSSMHTDTCPLMSFRGKVMVRLKQDIEDEYEKKIDVKRPAKKAISPVLATALELYTQEPNCFYFDKLFDRYMIKFYDVLLTENLLKYSNTEHCKSKNFLIALHKRFEFIFVETQRTKSLINTFSSNSCNCEICGQWCASTLDSINCVVCNKYYHMLCLDPPLLKKPSRGFSWSCAVCTKKHEIEYQSKKILMLSNDNKSSNAKQLSSELNALGSPRNDGTSPTMSPVESSTATPVEEADSQEEEEGQEVEVKLPKYELIATDFLNKDAHMSFTERRLHEEWCMRYLGMHSRLEDGVDLEDRSPYPRASTRLGSKHQATNIPECDDHHIVYYDVEKPQNTKKKNGNTTQKSGKNTIEIPAKLEVPKEFKDVQVKEYPQWLQPRPKGYIERGVDDGEGVTCSLLWKSKPTDNEDNFAKLDKYVEQCSPVAEKLNILPTSPNFMDKILKLYMDNEGDIEKCLNEVNTLTRKILKEPTFNREEVKRFEAGVKEFGSELYYVAKKVKSQSCSMVVRYYYLWKKTKNGRLIWGNFEGRIQKKVQNITREEAMKAEEKTDHPSIDDLADPEDDSSYEEEKSISQSRKFFCKHCHTHESIQWYRITGNDANKKNDSTVQTTVTALCFRCARLWRRYAVMWVDPNEVDKVNNKNTGWKRKIESELLRDATDIWAFAELLGAVLSHEDEELVPSITLLDVAKIKSKVKPQELEKNGNGRSVSTSDNSPGPSPKKKKVSKPVPSRKPSQVSANTKPSSKATKSNGELAPKVKAVKKTENKPKTARMKKETENESQGSIKEIGTTETKGRKRKIKGDVDNSDELNPGILVTTTKRQKKPPHIEPVFNPLSNPDYIEPKFGKVDRKTYPVLTKDILTDLVSTFRTRQLVDITSSLQTIQIPPSTTIELPFESNERKCCVCREHSSSDSSNSEMLICSHCGVNSHSTCCGVNIPENGSRPVKQWLCDTCVNDLNPSHSTLYSCSLCFANESNYELSMLGSPLVRPDFLKPIQESGRWCHLLCALFNHDLVDFSHLGSERKVTKDELHSSSVQVLSNIVSIGSVSKIYIRNFRTRCGICDSRNGSLIDCELCQDEEKYHVTCAQDTPNFKLGFKLQNRSSLDKDVRSVKVGDSYGRLKPILVCPKHDQSASTIFNLRTLGKRAYGSIKEEQKPLMQLFLEDVVKDNVSKLTGPQFRSHSYVQNNKLFEMEQDKLKSEYPIETFAQTLFKDKAKTISCFNCRTIASPMWWRRDVLHLAQTEKSQIHTNLTSDAGTYLCQTCHNDQDSSDKEVIVDDIMDTLNQPLNGDNYGIRDEHDRLSDLYTPNLTCYTEKPTTASENNRSRIAIVDILS